MGFAHAGGTNRKAAGFAQDLSFEPVVCAFVDGVMAIAANQILFACAILVWCHVKNLQVHYLKGSVFILPPPHKNMSFHWLFYAEFGCF